MSHNVNELTAGYELPYLIKSITFEKIRMFTGWMGESNPHTNVEFAKSVGLPTAVAQGLMSHTYIIELLTRFFGRDWLEGGEISVYFVKPVFEGDKQYAKATIRDRKTVPEGILFTLDVWCENQFKEQTAVGTASFTLRSENF